MAIALPYHVTLAQQVPTGVLTCQLQAGVDSAFLPVTDTAASAILGAACVRFDTTFSGCITFQSQPAFAMPEACEQPGAWAPLEPHAQVHHAGTSRKRAADCQLLHPAPSKQRCTPPHVVSPAARLSRRTVHKARRPPRSNEHTPQWIAVSPVHTTLGPADCSSASCPTATSSSTAAAVQPAPLQQLPQLHAWSASPCHMAAHCVPQYLCAPAVPHHNQPCPPEASPLSQHSHLRLTPPQVSTHTSTVTATAWPAVRRACDCQPSYWGPSPAPQQQQLWQPSPAHVWEPSPSGSSCSASSWLPVAANSSCLQLAQSQQPQHLLQCQQDLHPQQLQHQQARPTNERTAILCHVATAAVLHPQRHHLAQPLLQLPGCQSSSHGLPLVTAAAVPQPPSLPPSVAWYSDANSPAALLEANDFMASVRLPGDVEYLRVPSGSAMHRLGVLCSVSAASICLAQSYYLRLRHCMPLLQSALRLLSSLPGAASTGAAQRRAAIPASPACSQAEAVITGVKFTCVALAAKMVEARSGQQKQLRGLLAHLTTSAVASTDTVAIEVRVLQHLDWRLGPYFLPPSPDCDAGDHWH